MNKRITAAEVRDQFLKFFESKDHKTVRSAPMVVKDDPTLMFTNAGMNQFKDFFLGNISPKDLRVTDTQKCLRVSGKHNDLEEVGVDTYHHTMFEMLGNWSFGDYFKEEAIAWAWELLTEHYKLDIDRLYVTVFEGDEKDNLGADEESVKLWSKWIDPQRILKCDKKDNFWEMGDTGPCGPCSEIHIDLRSQEERNQIDGKSLVNQDHEQVIELWNLVFMQYNRKANGSLENLPKQHVDTGMGLERIVRAINSQNSNYDIDLFADVIEKIQAKTTVPFGKEEKSDIAYRVIADHIRAIVFAIADGQLPSNDKAGYVIRRILRRAVRFGYSYLNLNKPFLNDLIPFVGEQYAAIFPEVSKQVEIIQKVVFEEEQSFLKTLSKGIEMLDKEMKKTDGTLDGEIAFILYDTFGFPIDLTRLIARENNIGVDEEGFTNALKEQKVRSKKDAKSVTSDWEVLINDELEEFIGYDYLSAEVKITRYREVKKEKNTFTHLVFDLTPFYAESGGQVGDKGVIKGNDDGEVVEILDTIKENNLIIHLTNKPPKNPRQRFEASVNVKERNATAGNHSATHLLHSALKKVLGIHVEQKGSLVDPDKLRFDFSHFSKVTDEEILQVEQMVNEKVRKGIALEEQRNIPIKLAKEKGATALFGEKYGDTVRMITFDPEYSIELCGGTHVKNTSEIGTFKIVSESSVAAGIRRIEAVSQDKADELVRGQIEMLKQVEQLMGEPKNLLQALQQLKDENQARKKVIESYEADALGAVKNDLMNTATLINGVNVIVEKVKVPNAGALKDLGFQLKNEVQNAFVTLAADIDGKPSLVIAISDSMVKENNWNAGKLIKQIASFIRGGGGGQPFIAQAGGSDVNGINKALEEASNWVKAEA